MTETTYLILSDSHGHPEAITEAIRRTRPTGILFAGDGLRDLTHSNLPCPLWAVRGNCDCLMTPLVTNGSLVEPPEEELFCLEGLRVLLLHGHRYGVKSGLGFAIAQAARREVDILIFGHTHIPYEHRLVPDMPEGAALRKPLFLFNPGSIGDSRTPTFGTLTLRGGVPLFGHGQL